MITTEEFLQALEKKNIRTFTLPNLQLEITYNKMDVIESSVNGNLPTFLASRVLDSMKKSIAGKNVEDENPNIEDKDVQELLVRATTMWGKLVTNPKLNDAQILQIDSQDRLAWFLHAIGESQEVQTAGGGLLTAEEIATFPDEGVATGTAKRSTNSKGV